MVLIVGVCSVGDVVVKAESAYLLGDGSGRVEALHVWGIANEGGLR